LPDPDRLVLIGVFGVAQGVRGEIRIKSFTGEPAALAAYGPLTDAERSRAFAFERLRRLRDDMLVAKVKGVESREAAAALTGVQIFARRGQLPPPGLDEFYYDDLVGLLVVTSDGERVGRVITLSNFGAGDILEIAPEGGGEALLLPFTKAVAPTIDFAAGTIVIEPPREIEVDEKT
jgi:16S rRNA processing protein RimM